MSNDSKNPKKIRPICNFCKHNPFRYESGLDWHLQHIHPVEYTAMTNGPASDFKDGAPPDPGSGSGGAPSIKIRI